MAQHDPIDMPSPNPPARVTPELAPTIGPVRPASGGEVKTGGGKVTNVGGGYPGGVEYPRPARDR
jgi:hypothetical protein